ncbi:MAG: hypothetical protein A2V65_11505 [Deltaproteobacteria bacterium RBG_13_49_15]|nr:MAG: hypothetical protein A2V65_11505 [Deltaproteobacteria bacterium RBG_13_49_15]
MTAKPFQISSDPKFLWLGEKHKEALAILKYGVLDSRGFLLLTGDVGTGKTTLIHALLQNLKTDVVWASIFDPGLEKLDFFNYVAKAFGINKTFTTKGEFLAYFDKFLQLAFIKREKVLLIIDEAQRISSELLEEIRLLSNFELEGTKLLNIFFVGQNELNEMLLDPKNKALRQRITINYNIEPLSIEETREYIQFRLGIVGVINRTVFTGDALTEIHRLTAGYPRRINILCDHALLTGYVRGVQIIDSGTVRECDAELRIPGQSEGTGAVEASGTDEAVGTAKGVAGEKADAREKKPEEVVTEKAGAVHETTVVEPVVEPTAERIRTGLFMKAGTFLLIALCVILAAGYFYRPEVYDESAKAIWDFWREMMKR